MCDAAAAPPWREPLERWLRAHAAGLGLDPARLQVSPVVNPSGWMANVACTVSDGSARLHVKLGDAREEIARLYDLRAQLQRHQAPPVLAFIDLDPWAGVVTPSIDGPPPTEALLPQLVAAANALHADRDLLARLPEHPRTFGQAFRDLWIERLAPDLSELSAEGLVPPFVSPSTFAWMQSEVARLADATAAPAFDAPTSGPAHNDLHLGNLLVDRDGAFWIIDWDEMGRGDPAADLAILLSAPLERGDPIEALLGPRDPAFRERFALCARAVLLDGVVDSLADWAHAGDAPSADDAAAIRAAKRAEHERCLAAYRARYGLPQGGDRR
jgi:hypothetical protein